MLSLSFQRPVRFVTGVRLMSAFVSFVRVSDI